MPVFKAAVLIFAAAIFADAQALGEPFYLIRIVRGAPRADADPTAIQPYIAAKAPIEVLGMKAITGSSQSWLIESHRSFGSIEAVERAIAEAPASESTRAELEDEAISPSNRMLGLYRHALGYRPDEAIKLLQTARYFQVSIYRIRPGADIDFAELIRIRKATFDSINLDRPEIGYQVISGGSSGTYVFLAPLPSLKTLDNGIARMPVYSEGIGHAGGPRAAGRQIQTEAEVTREHLLFRVQPRMSYVSDAFAAADPDFWRGR